MEGKNAYVMMYYIARNHCKWIYVFEDLMDLYEQ